MDGSGLEGGRREVAGVVLLDIDGVIGRDIGRRRGRIVLLGMREHARRTIPTGGEVPAGDEPSDVGRRQVPDGPRAAVGRSGVEAIRARWRRGVRVGLGPQKRKDGSIRRVRLGQSLCRRMRGVRAWVRQRCNRIQPQHTPLSSSACTMSAWPFLTASMSGVTPNESAGGQWAAAGARAGHTPVTSRSAGAAASRMARTASASPEEHALWRAEAMGSMVAVNAKVQKITAKNYREINLGPASKLFSTNILISSLAVELAPQPSAATPAPATLVVPSAPVPQSAHPCLSPLSVPPRLTLSHSPWYNTWYICSPSAVCHLSGNHPYCIGNRRIDPQLIDNLFHTLCR